MDKHKSDPDDTCPVCGNQADLCICCPECGHVCLLELGEAYCPVCSPIKGEDGKGDIKNKSPER